MLNEVEETETSKEPIVTETSKEPIVNDLNDEWGDSRIIMNFDHVNINTRYLEDTIKFYKLFGFNEGFRPSFSFNGAWLYLDHNIKLMLPPYPQTAYIHLVEVPESMVYFTSNTIDHIAFRCDVNLFKETQNLLDKHDISYKYNRVLLEKGYNDKSQPPEAIDQIFIHDPNEIKVELNFRK